MNENLQKLVDWLCLECDGTGTMAIDAPIYKPGEGECTACDGTGRRFKELSKECPAEKCQDGVLVEEDLPFQHIGEKHKFCGGTGRVLAEIHLEDLQAIAFKEPQGFSVRVQMELINIAKVLDANLLVEVIAQSYLTEYAEAMVGVLEKEKA